MFIAPYRAKNHESAPQLGIWQLAHIPMNRHSNRPPSPAFVMHCLVAALLWLLYTPLSHSKGNIHFSCTSRPEQRDFKYALHLYARAFEKIGYKFQMTHLPSHEVSAEKFETHLDGDCGRLPNFQKVTQIDNLLSVNPPIRTATLSSWKLATDKRKLLRTDSRIQLSPQFLAISPYLEAMGFRHIQTAKNYKTLLKQLHQGRTDRIVIYEAENTHDVLTTKWDMVRDETLMVVPIQPLLHKRHSKLLPALKDSLKQLMRKPTKHTDATSVEPVPNNHKEKNLIFTCALPPSHPATEATKKMYQQLFESVGLGYQHVYTPVAEESALLARGNFDGSCGRAERFQQANPTLIRVDPAVGLAHLRLWSGIPQNNVYDLSSLSNKTSIVVAGMTKNLEYILRSFPGTVVTVRTPEQAFKMVIAGRADYFLGFTTVPLDQLHAHQIKSPLFLSGAIKYGEVYLYLHAKHHAIVKPLSTAMRSTMGSYPTLLHAWLKRMKKTPLQ